MSDEIKILKAQKEDLTKQLQSKLRFDIENKSENNEKIIELNNEVETLKMDNERLRNQIIDINN